MRIALVTTSWPFDADDPAGHFVRSEAQLYEQAGHDVVVFAPKVGGAFGWPGAFGTWWQADPAEDLIAIYLVQDSMPLGPETVANLAARRGLGGRAALPVFQKLAYAALGK